MKWINDNGDIYDGKSVVVGDVRHISPTDSKLIELGYHKVEEQPQEPTTEQLIWELKAQLAESDYRVIKCSEAMLAGLPMPYDVEQLHAERQAIRDQINAMENQ